MESSKGQLTLFEHW